MSEPTVTIRDARPEDADRIAQIQVEGWRTAYAGIIPAPLLAQLEETTRAHAWKTRIDDPDDDAETLVAEAGGQVIAFVSVGRSRDDDLDIRFVEIFASYVAPDHWDTGIGSMLLERAVEVARRLHGRTLTLWVLELNERGRRFYRHRGFAPDGATKPMKVGSRELTLVRYRKSLRE